MRARLLPLTILTVALVAAAHGIAASASGGRGHLVLIGGGDKPDDAMRTFVEVAGGPEALILLIPTASASADAGAGDAKLLARTYGCRDVRVLAIRNRRDAGREEYVGLVERAGGVYFGGGDQARIMVALRGSPVLAAIERAFARGAAIGGTSAGTACQTPLMITGEGDFTVIRSNSVELWDGLGLLRGVVVDQHFVVRQRSNRLISVILEHPDLLGVGIDEDTAVWVRPDGTFKVLGHRSVMVLDAGGAAVSRRANDTGQDGLGVHDLRVHVLLPGEEYDLASRAVLPAAAPPPAGGSTP